ncbi:hypothetical protein [Arthrobacter sp. M4]|uniref:hypothetical protein n=1 Tax=Arthrobacter sp. M4 TaxID=218160 RepID=UPI001CDD358D|nr:hypothetical protein [Arthrobacter sp. M4]MCA4131783.1 hypothetical protein [Arthrobacter sp. M4]
MFNNTAVRIRAGHLMVRSAAEWDDLSNTLCQAYHAKDDELIDQLRSPFLQSWRTVTAYVLSDVLDSAGITATAARHPWGIATLTTAGRTCEPLLCAVDQDEGGWDAAAIDGGLQLLNFDSVMTGYAACVAHLTRVENQK